MAVKIIRSPRYPTIGLKEAIEKVALVYKADYRNKIPKELVAKHMGYGGLNGASLGVVSAVSKYGLLDGGRDAMWVTPRAVDILEREQNDPERLLAIQAAAIEPDLFRELDDNFPEKASDAALRSFLITKRDFLPESAVKLIRAYRETHEFLNTECGHVEKNAPAPSPQTEIASTGPFLSDQVEQPQSATSAPVSSSNSGEREWMRGPLSRQTNYRVLVSGEMGPREIGKLIKLLEAQRSVLVDDDDDLVG